MSENEQSNDEAGGEPLALLIQGGEVYDPSPLGRRDVLVLCGRVAKIGDVDRRALDALGVPYEVVDASDGYVVPGFIDPHQHLLGGSGEGGFELQTPMLFAPEIVRAGITTVVGVLGVDTTMKTMAGLLARVKALDAEGLSTRMWSGGYNVPPTTLMGSIRKDMLFIHEVIGAGEVAVSDERGLNQSAQELASLVRDTYVGGLLSKKAGVTHFHVGEEPTRLRPLRDIVEQFGVRPELLYPTHVQRNEELLREAVELARQGATVDFDVAAQDLDHWYGRYEALGGPPDRLTVSSDADSGTPDMLYEQLCGLVVKRGVPLERMLPHVTSNTARVLKLTSKGRVAERCDADLVVLQKGTLEIREVIADGRRLLSDGEPTVRPAFFEESARRFTIAGDKAPPRARRFR